MKKRISETLFREMINDALSQDSSERLPEEIRPMYAYVENYAMENGLCNTAIALALVRAMVLGSGAEGEFRFADENILQHSLAITRMLIDMHIPLSEREEDILLAAALCHVLPENIRFQSLEEELTEHYYLDGDVAATINLVVRKENVSNAEQREFFRKVRENKLALLVLLADQSNIVEQLYLYSTWSARRYIYETRNHFFPLCVYAKEYYQDILGPINILMEKMRSLVEIADILLSRFEAREAELSQEILALQEENAIIKGIIHSA